MNRTKPQVLLVDDEWIIRQQLTRALDIVGVKCHIASNGDDALEKHDTYQYPLVVTDLRMPGCHGHSLAVALLNQPTPPTVVVLTGVVEPRLTHDLLKRGVESVIYKPFNCFDFASDIKARIDPATDDSESQPVNTDRPPHGEVLNDTVLLESGPIANGETVLPDSHSGGRERIESEIREHAAVPRALEVAFRWVDWTAFPKPPTSLFEFSRTLSRPSAYRYPDRRKSPRVVLHKMGLVMALNDSLEPDCEPFKVVVRDISREGIGLVHTQPIQARYLGVTWSSNRSTPISVVVRVLRCRQLGDDFDIGGMIESNRG